MSNFNELDDLEDYEGSREDPYDQDNYDIEWSDYPQCTPMGYSLSDGLYISCEQANEWNLI